MIQRELEIKILNNWKEKINNKIMKAKKLNFKCKQWKEIKIWVFKG